MKTKESYLQEFIFQVKEKADALMNYFLLFYLATGIILAFYYDTWLVATVVGGVSLAAYYTSKWALPASNLYQYVLSTVFGIFMAQFIYQMHGLFEMHFWAFIGSAVLIVYQNWKLQIPIALVVIVHHATFGYLQYIGYEQIYFTQLDYMTLQTFIIHGLLATAIFFLCGFWAYHIKKMNETQLLQSLEIGNLQNDMIEKIRAEENLIRTETEMRNFATHLNNVLEDERKRIAGEIHDELGQRIVGIKMALSSFTKKIGSVNGAEDRMREIISDADDALHSMKKIVTELRPAILDTLGLLPSIEWLVKEVEKNTEMKCRLTLPSREISIDNTLSAGVFRICQEALTNVQKHSGASEVCITVNEQDKVLSLQVKDNGKGIHPSDLKNKLSTGLLGMRERAKIMGAELNIESEQHVGTTITLTTQFN